MKKEWVFRLGFFVLGLMCISLGVTLNTRTGLGVSPITTVPYSIAQASGLSFSGAVFIVYSVMLGIQFVIRGKHRRWIDLCQIPVSLLFSAFLDWFGSFFTFTYDSLLADLAVLVAAIVSMGAGIAMTVGMQLVPNPPDGLVAAVAWAVKRELGLMKNLVDLCCVIVALTVDLVFSGGLVSVGLGTVLVGVFTGRVVTGFNYFFKAPMLRLAGVAESFKETVDGRESAEGSGSSCCPCGHDGLEEQKRHWPWQGHP